MHVDDLFSLQQGDLPKPREGALQHHCGDYDLKQMKHVTLDRLEKRNITVTFKHVNKAHQDKKDKQNNIILLTQPA